MNTLAQGAGADLTGWYIGFGIGIFVVLVVVALVVPILVLASRIGKQAPAINLALQDAERNTRPLADLRTTIEHADVITAGLRRGRERLGG